MKKRLKITLQLLVTAVACYLVIKQINQQQLRSTLERLQIQWLLLALVLYNVSQFASSARLLGFYRKLGLPLTYLQNLGIYYSAMFYGLFLPGGVSGDVYKVLTLQKQYKKGYRDLITATLSDRINGLVVLLSIDLVLIWFGFSKLKDLLGENQWMIPLLLVAGWLIYLGAMHFFAKQYFNTIPKATAISLLVQGLQFIAFCCILNGLSVPLQQWLYYGILFYVGGVLSALPVSISGIGMREWAMVTGSALFGLDETIAFMASFCFFLITAFSALSGGFILWGKQWALQPNPKSL